MQTREEKRQHYRDQHGFGSLVMAQDDDTLDAQHDALHNKYNDLNHYHHDGRVVFESDDESPGEFFDRLIEQDNAADDDRDELSQADAVAELVKAIRAGWSVTDDFTFETVSAGGQQGIVMDLPPFGQTIWITVDIRPST